MDGAGWNRIAFGIDTRSSSILIGCLLGLVLPRVRLPKRLEPLIVAALIAALAVPLTDVALFTGPPFIVSVLTALLICSVLTTDSTIARVLSTRVFVFLGVISYALYLWHIPIFEAFGVDDGHTGLKAVPAVALSIAAAVASYYLVELPFLRRKRRAVSETEPTTNLTRPHLRRKSPLLDVPAADRLRSESSPTSA